MFKELIWGIILILTWLLVHEIAHYIIFIEHGCTDVRFEVGVNEINGNKIVGVATVAYDCSNVDNFDTMMLAQDINEIVGYTICPFLIIIAFIISMREM